MFAYINVEYENKSIRTCCKGYILEQGFVLSSVKIIYIMYKCLKRLHRCKSLVQECVI